MLQINVKATAKIYISAIKGPIKIKGFNGFDINIEGKDRQKDHHKIVTMEGKITENNIDNIYLHNLLESVMSWIALYFDTPITDLKITSIRKKTKNSKGTMVEERAMTLKGIRLINKKEMKNFNTHINEQVKKDITAINLYKEARAENSPTAKFWQLYNILQIIVDKPEVRNKRIAIDDFLKKNFNLKTIINDYKNQKITKITGIRDTFSHSDFSFDKGKKLNLQTQTREINPVLQNICRKLLEKKYKIPKQSI